MIEEIIKDQLSISLMDLQLSITLCKELEIIVPEFGCHVALTGGCLYKDGPRKDADILLYRIRDQEINWPGLRDAVKKIDFLFTDDFGWCQKAIWRGKYRIDVFDPDSDGTYEEKL